MQPGPSARDETSQSDELALLLTVTNSFSSGASAHEVLDSLYDELQQILPFDRMEHAVLDETGHVLTTEWFRATYSSKLVPIGYAYRRPEPIARNERYRVTTLENDLPAYALDRPYDHPVSLLVAEGICSSLSCPLVVADKVVGYLFFNRRIFDGYTSHQLNLIQLIAGQLASTLEQSRLNDQLREQNEQLRDLEKSRLEFIASISHELRTPLTAVVGFASELQDRVDRFSPEEISQFVGVIAAQSNEVSGIVEDLLVITRAEAGHLRVNPGPVNIASEVREVVASLPDERPAQTITLDIQDGVVWADALRVRQIARNLLSNAVRYGGDRVEVAISIDGCEVLLTVVDDGDGIPEHDREMVFQAYGRSQLSEGKPGSIGLGLTVSRYLAAAMNGSLHYKRVDDKSRFSMRLPLYRPGRSRYDRA
jgi:signal transduction histidine kinase